MKKPDISVVLIEYHSLDDLDRCVSSLCKGFESIDYEIIISSNSLYDTQKQEKIKQLYSGLTWSFNKKNGGFAYGMNRGLEKARGKYLIIANPDTIILNGFLKMVNFMDIHPEIGAIAPQVVDQEENIQDTCRPYLSLPRYIIRQFKRFVTGTAIIYNDNFDYNKVQTVDWLVGAFIMVRSSVYKLTHGLDEGYFMYAEDIDWCTRIRKCGFEIIYFPMMKVMYKGSREARKFNKYTWIFIKSHLRYWSKHGFFYGYPKRKKLVF